MRNRNLLIIRSAAMAAMLAVPAAVHAQDSWSNTDWDSDSNMELNESEFNAGLSESGTYNAWDSDETAGLSEGEFATGMYSDWDADNDRQISEEEFNAGSERWYGSDYEGTFANYDTDESGFVDTNEFGSSWDNDYYAGWDTNDDSLLDENEFNTGVYGTVDTDDDKVVTIEEEGWFEGWFDGDDVEAEIRDVGEVL